MARLQFAAVDTRAVHHVAKHLRRHDLLELQAVHGVDLDVLACLRAAVLASEECHTVVAPDGEPVGLFGVAPLSLLEGQGCPWLLGTETLMGYPRDIVVLGKRTVNGWCLRYDQLYNYVDARNLRSIAWLRRLGFSVFPPQPYGVQGLPFHRFERCT